MLCTVALPDLGTSTQEETEQVMRLAVGAVASIAIALFAASHDEPSDGNVRFASLEELSRIVLPLSVRESVAM